VNQVAVGIDEPQAVTRMLPPVRKRGRLRADAAARFAHLALECAEIAFETIEAEIRERFARGRKNARPTVSVECAQLQLRVGALADIAHVETERAVEMPRVVDRRHVQREMID